MILIDASVFLEFFLDQKDSEACASLLDKVGSGEIESVVTHFAIHGIEATLERGSRLNDFLRNIENSRGLRIFDTSVSDEIAISIMAEKIGKDFDDTLQYFVAKKVGAKSIVSFDKHFDGLDIPRKEPSDVLDTKER
jgi:predicted nucleic acid-binding protein